MSTIVTVYLLLFLKVVQKYLKSYLRFTDSYQRLLRGRGVEREREPNPESRPRGGGGRERGGEVGEGRSTTYGMDGTHQARSYDFMVSDTPDICCTNKKCEDLQTFKY